MRNNQTQATSRNKPNKVAHPDGYLRPGPTDGIDIYDVSAVIATREENGVPLYLVVWSGWPVEEATWEPSWNVGDGYIAEFEAREQDVATIDTTGGTNNSGKAGERQNVEKSKELGIIEKREEEEDAEYEEVDMEEWKRYGARN